MQKWRKNFLQDFEMEQKIELEIKLRELAAQSMLEARNELDLLEVEKSLLASDQRVNCYTVQLEARRKELSNSSLSTDSGRGSRWGNIMSRNTGSGRRNGSCKQNEQQQHRSDVIGAASCGTSSNGDTSSPSYSSPSSQSPSKLSPTSGQSANSPSLTNSSHHSRTGIHRYSTTTNNVSTTKRRNKNKRREQLMQSITSMSNINCNMVNDNRATISISEIRIPLMWRDVDHFKGRGDYKRFAIFCLIKIDSQIYDTQLIGDVDRNVTDVTFDDVVVFNEIDHNFELTFEVYSCVYLEQFSFSSTPRKLREKLSNSVGRTMGRRLATQMVSSHYTKELQAYDKFALIASATLRLDDASDSVKTYDLVLKTPSAHHRTHSSSNNSAALQQEDPFSNYSNTMGKVKDAHKNTLPLFGHFCCKLFVKPDVFDKCIKTGYLKVARMLLPPSANVYNNNNEEQVTGVQPIKTTKSNTIRLSASVSHWAMLRNFALYLWPIDEYKLYSAIMNGQPPVRSMDNLRKPSMKLNLDKFSRLLRVSNSSLTIETDQGCFVLGALCPDGGVLNQAEEMAHWLRAIEQPIYDSHIWGSVLGHHYPAKRAAQNQASTSMQSYENSIRHSRYMPTEVSIVKPETTTNTAIEFHKQRLI